MFVVVGDLTRLDGLNEPDDLGGHYITEAMRDGLKHRERLFKKVVFSVLVQGSQRFFKCILQCLCRGIRLGCRQPADGFEAKIEIHGLILARHQPDDLWLNGSGRLSAGLLVAGDVMMSGILNGFCERQSLGDVFSDGERDTGSLQ